MKIHRGRTRCGKQDAQEHCTEVSGEMEEDQSQEEPHSAQDHQAQENLGSTSCLPERRSRVKWPALSNTQKQLDLDEELDKVLEAALAEGRGTANNNLQFVC